MSYLVLARKYRSQDFGELVGQGAVAKTLLSAIQSGRLAHAYLFTGTRGVGKTSTARLFARALNAPDTLPGTPHGEGKEYPSKDIQGRMAEAIMRGDDLNVIEIDGASNNSVDQARELISKAGLSPVSGAPYKIYIIDEVHMLTQAAFNALLKTMEEPPAHVKFILCTTEPHKVIPTIQSRCQKFNFRSIPAAEVKKHLADLCAKENIKADEDVLFQVAALGGGSMRDALSLLDRLIATGAQPVTLQVLEEMLGLPPQAGVAQLVDALADGDAAKALDRVDQLIRSGIAQEQLIDALIERLRHLMIACACGAESAIIEASEQTRQGLAAQAKRFDAPGLVYTLTLCENLKRFTKDSTTARAMLDASIVRLALSEKMADLPSLLAQQADAVKKKLSSEPEDRNSFGTSPGTAGLQAGPGAAGLETRGGMLASARAGVNAGEPGAGLKTGGPGAEASDAGRSASSPSEAWSLLLAREARRPLSAWMESFRPCADQPEAGVLRLEPLPGKRDMTAFAQSRMGWVGEEIKKILGAPCRAHLEAKAQTPAPVRGAAFGGIPKDKVMALPLVQAAMEILEAMPYDAQAWSPAAESDEKALASDEGSGDNAAAPAPDFAEFADD